MLHLITIARDDKIRLFDAWPGSDIGRGGSSLRSLECVCRWRSKIPDVIHWARNEKWNRCGIDQRSSSTALILYLLAIEQSTVVLVGVLFIFGWWVDLCNPDEPGKPRRRNSVGLFLGYPRLAEIKAIFGSLCWAWMLGSMDRNALWLDNRGVTRRDTETRTISM